MLKSKKRRNSKLSDSASDREKNLRSVFLSKLSSAYSCEDGEFSTYKMTVIYSRPQESPLFQKISFLQKMKAFVWAIRFRSRSVLAKCWRAAGAKYKAGREGSDEEGQSWPGLPHSGLQYPS